MITKWRHQTNSGKRYSH